VAAINAGNLQHTVFTPIGAASSGKSGVIIARKREREKEFFLVSFKKTKGRRSGVLNQSRWCSCGMALAVLETGIILKMHHTDVHIVAYFLTG